MTQNTVSGSVTLPELSVVVPCYNEGINVRLILNRFAEVRGNLNMELILVDNGSSDNTAQILQEELAKPEYSFARTVLVQKNVGYGNGITFGLQHARADIVAYTHADMQCDPYDVVRAYHELRKKEQPHQHLVKGWRSQRKIVPKVLSTGFRIIASLLFFQNYQEINAQPKVFHRTLLEQMQYPPLDFNLDFYVLYKAKQGKVNINTIPVEFPERQYGESKWAFSHLSKLKTIHNFLRYMVKLRTKGEEHARSGTFSSS